MVQTISSLVGSPLLLPNVRHRKTVFGHRCNRCRVTAARRDDDYGGGNGTGRVVDENMIVLRKRIQEMKIVEERDQEAPEDWMEWEKRYYTHYDSDVFEAVGLLQTQLMKMRPSVALGMLALVTLSVPTSMFMVALHLMEMAKWILSGIHLS